METNAFSSTGNDIYHVGSLLSIDDCWRCIDGRMLLVVLRFDCTVGALLQVRLIVLGEMSFLSECFAAETACKRFLA